MKAPITLLLLFLSISCIHAQIQRGDILLTLGGIGGLNRGGTIGGASYDTKFDAATVYVLPTFGYALTDRIVLGGTTGFMASMGLGANTVFYLNPYARYYVLNKEKLSAFAQVSTGFSADSDGVSLFDELNLGMGLQFPVAPGILFGPTIDYTLGGRRNTVNFGANFEIRLGSNTRPEEPVVAGFRKGSIMLGSQFVSASFRKNIAQGGIAIGGHYFLTDRLTAALYLGGGASDFEFGTSSQPRSYRSGSFSIDLGSRYYLTTRKRLVWFAEGGAGFRRSSFTSVAIGQESSSRSNSFNLSAGAGAQYFLRENVSLDVMPQVRHIFDGASSTTTLGLNVGASFIINR
ncbi:hypothetical protein LEM8419_03339 [Neolewinella maritima]|uniref:Outer membrane protein beta-barrel domain-containing protein n=1 Tax=Neolewinella maritima TaxID=1383882 RepID=A0ABM9B579_9BACT|nr:outer membrane beta-barrel protein [Neolewinella maritima]CAH1002460.1 hypothetical protein LEM8419_03339 [Neolewinella maritima]